MSLATVASVVGIGAGAYSMYKSSRSPGGSSGGGSGLAPYQPTWQGGADQQWQDLQRQLGGAVQHGVGQIQPALDKSFGDLSGLDTSGLRDAGAWAGNDYAMLAALANQYGGNMNQAAGVAQQGQKDAMGRAGQIAGYGADAMRLAMDPQKEMYQQQYQQTVDQSRAASSARGIGMGAESVGLENQATRDFMSNWTNQQLGRVNSTLNAASGAYGQAGNLMNAGMHQGQLYGANMDASMGFYGQAPGFGINSQQVPFNMNAQAAGWPMQAAGMYGQAMNSGVYNPLSSAAGNVIPYLNYGQGANQNGFNAFQTGMNNFTTGLQQFGQYAPGTFNRVNDWFGGGNGMTPGSGSTWTDQPVYTDTTGPQFGTP